MIDPKLKNLHIIKASNPMSKFNTPHIEIIILDYWGAGKKGHDDNSKLVKLIKRHLKGFTSITVESKTKLSELWE